MAFISESEEPNFLAVTTSHTTRVFERGSSGCVKFIVRSEAYSIKEEETEKTNQNAQQ